MKTVLPKIPRHSREPTDEEILRRRQYRRLLSWMSMSFLTVAITACTTGYLLADYL